VLDHAVAAPQNDEHVIRASVCVNLLLLIGKGVACLESSSPAILASLVDSSVDVLVQAALFWAGRVARRGATSLQYPIGRGQLEPVSVVVCAALKVAGMAAVAAEAISVLHFGDKGEWRERHGMGHVWRHHWEMVSTLALLSVTKLAFCTWCEVVVHGRRATTTETVRAVLADNQNEVVLSTGALLALILTESSPHLWWCDPSMALALSLYIFVRWMETGRAQVDLIIGRAADPHFLEMVREIAETHDPSASLDVVRAYHYGTRFLVELELVMEASTPLRESHDCGILLQHKIEALPAVERCFVHVDYEHRDHDDHDFSTPASLKTGPASPNFEDRGSVPPSCSSLANLLRDEDT